MKLDFKKALKQLYTPSEKAVVVVDVPQMNFLMIDGRGDPNTSQEFQEAVEALYGLSFTLKFMLKKEEVGKDYIIPPLEGLWWMDDMTEFDIAKKKKWMWTLMIMQPDFITADHVDKAKINLEKRKNPPALSKVRFESFHEGLSAQITHIGPYSAERPTIEKIHTFTKENGYELRGNHHEIYLSDPRKTAPERIKTVLRQPLEKK